MGEWDFRAAVKASFQRHAPYMSTEDEREIARRALIGADEADLAIRTCLCGRHLEGADDLHMHLERVALDAIDALRT